MIALIWPFILCIVCHKCLLTEIYFALIILSERRKYVNGFFHSIFK